MKRSEIRSLEAIRRRIKILEIIQNNPMSTKMIYTKIQENPGRVMEDIKRLKEWQYIEELPDRIYCELGCRVSLFYQRTSKAYEGYEFLQKMSQHADVEKALKEYRQNYGMFNAGNAKLKTTDVYIKVPDNPHATIVMNSNRPVGFYSYQKHKHNVNRGIGSTFALYDMATGGL
jgi:hypothetical protein